MSGGFGWLPFGHFPWGHTFPTEDVIDEITDLIDLKPSEVLNLDMYKFILEPIRQADNTREGANFLKRFLQGPQTMWAYTNNKIFALKKLLSITECPDEYLQYLKNFVGWTNELNYITDNLKPDVLRRLIATSIPLWRLRGREETLIDILTLVTGYKCQIWNWFDYRWIVDETILGEDHQGRDPWVIDSPGPPDYGEYLSVLHIVDDGGLDHELVKNMVRFMRPISERIEIAYIDFFEKFTTTGDYNQWKIIDGTTPMVVDNGYGMLDDLTERQSYVVKYDAPLGWNDYVVYFRISGNGSGGNYGCLFYWQNEQNYYELQLNIDSSGDDWQINRCKYGVKTKIAGGSIPQEILDDIWYGIRIHINKDGSKNRIKLYIDVDEIANIIDIPDIYAGSIGFYSDTSTIVKLDECELFQLPLTTELIDINS